MRSMSKGEARCNEARRNENRHSFGIFLAMASLVAVTLAAGTARAVTFTVNTSADTHDKTLGDGKCSDSTSKCSLRAAIEENNRSNAGATINIGTYTIKLSTAAGFGQLEVTAAATINGNGSANTIIDAQGKSRVMQVSVISLILSGVTLRNGIGCKELSSCGSARPGGELYITSSGYVTARHSVFTTDQTMASVPNNNLPAPGGGIHVEGSLDMTNCTVSNNSTPTDTSGGAFDSGGGIALASTGFAQIYYSTISGNSAQRGGGIATGGGGLKLVNSTVSGNSSKFEGGGGIYVSGTGTGGSIQSADVMYTTIAYNQITNPRISATYPYTLWGGGIRTTGGVLNLGKCIVSFNTDGRASSDTNYAPDIGQDTTSTIVSYDDNLIGIVGNHLGNYVGADGNAYDWVGNAYVSLGPLAFNGGETMTHYLQDGDPIDSYSGDGGSARFASPGDDQTHYPRPDDGNGDGVAAADSGSFEF